MLSKFRKSFFSNFSPFIISLLLFSCANSSNDDFVEVIDDNNQINTFFFSEDDNPSLTEYVPSMIDRNSNAILVQLPSGADINSLIPRITLSGPATISPDITVPIDFSVPVEFIVTSESGNKNTYTVEASLSSESSITAFYFKRSENNGLEEDLYGEINHFNKTILIDLPLAADIKNLNPTLVLDAKNAQGLDDLPNDFSDIKHYEITADDGKKSMYTVSVSYDRNVLIEFGRVNDVFSRMRWSLNTNHNSWEGIEVDEWNRVTVIATYNCLCVKKIIPEIGRLTELTHLRFGSRSHRYEDVVQELPAEIGNLVKLETLWLDGMELGNVPKEIGNLVKLKFLRLGSNYLTSIPNEVGNLIELDELGLSGNELTALPSEIGNLKKLRYFTTGNNLIEEIPTSFQNLETLETILISDNEIAEIPSELGNLPKLLTFWIGNNKLTSVPKELSNITTLQSLQVYGNQITSIPKEICDMRTLYGTSIVTDDGVICEE